MADDDILEARGLSKRFGTNPALKAVSIGLRLGEVHAVVGENGAGKSTLMNILCGKLAADEGTLRRAGKPLVLGGPSDAQRAGIAIAPQELTLCPELTVAENVALGAHRKGALGIDWKATRAFAAKHLANIDDSIDPDARVRTLSTARQQLVQIARATASEADILIFDEPTASLTTRETGRLFDFIARFRARPGAIFYISHRLEEVLSLADRISVLRDGALVAELDARTATKDEIVRHMVGRPLGRQREHAATPAAQGVPVVLRIDGLTRAGEFAEVGLDLHKGEILGVAGLIGAGRTELAKCIFGITRPERGGIEIDGRPVRHRFPADAIVNGLAYLPEERKKEGIFPLLSVAENMCLASPGLYRGIMGLSPQRMMLAARAYVERLGIRPPTPRIPVASLSGGNQQKSILGRWLMSGCRILILDEPTRGVDVNAKFEIQSLLRDLAAQGLSILYISSELQEVLDVSDRILVMHEGRAKGIVEAAGATQETLMGMAMS